MSRTPLGWRLRLRRERCVALSGGKVSRKPIALVIARRMNNRARLRRLSLAQLPSRPVQSARGGWRRANTAGPRRGRTPNYPSRPRAPDSPRPASARGAGSRRRSLRPAPGPPRRDAPALRASGRPARAPRRKARRPRRRTRRRSRFRVSRVLVGSPRRTATTVFTFNEDRDANSPCVQPLDAAASSVASEEERELKRLLPG